MFAESQLRSRLKRLDGWREAPAGKTVELAQLGAMCRREAPAHQGDG
ncbi:hypothetical protein RZS08_24655 [Arthrospira platensis SPKY1]|nr:hypothetical protein [Arthrospira platensis SPKY1]